MCGMDAFSCLCLACLRAGHFDIEFRSKSHYVKCSKFMQALYSVSSRIKDFSLRRLVQPNSYTHTVSFTLSTSGYFSGDVGTDGEANHAPPLNSKLKNVWNLNSTPPVRLHDMELSHTKFLSWTSSEDLGVERIILKWILNKYDLRMYTEFRWLRMGFCRQSSRHFSIVWATVSFLRTLIHGVN